MFGRIKKTIEEGNFSYDSPEIPIGETVNIRIHERTNHQFGAEWFLIDVDFAVEDVYCSDKMVDNGEVIRLYTDPSLGDYHRGNYIWLDSRQIEAMPTNNISAKHLLTLAE